MKVTLYSTGCPQCMKIEALLKSKEVQFELSKKTISEMIDMGFMSTPILQVDDEKMNFESACKWISGYKNN